MLDVVTLLRDFLEAPAHLEWDGSEGRSGRVADAVIRAGDETFVVEYKHSGSPAIVAGAIHQLDGHLAGGAGQPRPIPLLVVPYMSVAGREIARRQGLSWVDLSGNAQIRTPHLVVRIDGQPNRFKERGRPSTPFAPKSSRISRWFLMNTDREISQQELAEETRVDPGQLSRIVRRLIGDSLLLRTQSGALKVANPDLLLDAWGAEYDFRKHSIVEGHIPARSGPESLSRLAGAFEPAGIRYAATGLAAAWQLTRFAAFRLVTIYIGQPLPSAILAELGFRNESRGANVWIVTPNDAGVFDGAEMIDGVRCAHPVQVYLDLMSQPERAAEAAAELRERRLPWSSHDG